MPFDVRDICLCAPVIDDDEPNFGRTNSMFVTLVRPSQCHSSCLVLMFGRYQSKFRV